MKRIDSLPNSGSRPDDGHKGTFGRVLVVAGSRGMSGAACLSAAATLRSGSGLVYVAVPDSITSIVAGFEPSYLTLPFPEDTDGRIALTALESIQEKGLDMDAIAIGPGLGLSTDLRLIVTELYRSLEIPMVVDADGLNLLAKSRERLGDHAGPRILTPHVGEFGRLTGLSVNEIQSDREGHAGRFAGGHGVTLLLKGPGTIVTDGSQVAVNTTGNAGLATGGTGDVLTGVTASLLGQGSDPFDAAQLAAHIQGRAGDIAARTLGKRSLIASDLLEFLPEAWRTVDGV